MMALITRVAALGPDEQIYKEVVQRTILEAVHKGLRSKADVGAHTRTHTLFEL